MKTRHIRKKITEKRKRFAKGLVTMTCMIIDTPEAEALDKELSLASPLNMTEEIFLAKQKRLREICKVREHTFENWIHLSGRAVFAARLVNELTYTGVINYGALGTSAAAINDAHTQLTAEVKRKGVAVYSRTSDTSNLRFYYSKADTSGTYQEFGTFIDGTASANTGQMFNRVLTGGWTKSSSESLTVTVQFDFNSV